LNEEDKGNRIQKPDEKEINKIHENAWANHGWKYLEKDPKASEWLRKRFDAEPNTITRISGTKMSENDKRGLEILSNPTEKMFKPSIQKITIGIMAGGHIAYRRAFQIKLE
jgi:hypothetical protein